MHRRRCPTTRSFMNVTLLWPYAPVRGDEWNSPTAATRRTPRRTRARPACPFPSPGWRGGCCCRRSGCRTRTAFLQQLNVALHVGLDRRQPDQEEAGRHLHREAGQRHAAGLLGLLHQHAGHVLHAAGRRVRRQVEHDLDGVAGRQRRIGVAAQRPGHAHLALGNFDVGAHRKLGRPARRRRHHLGAPHRRAEQRLPCGSSGSSS